MLRFIQDKYFHGVLLFFMTINLQSQSNYTDYNLPLLLINTHGQEILDNDRIVAELKIINYGQSEPTSDTLFNYNGSISIEHRGSTSLGYKKKQYSLETQGIYGENNNVSLLGLPRENDWILNGPYMDKSLMRNVLAYTLAQKTGRYASRTKFCEFFLNGEYRGVYVLMEKLKRDINRVDVQEFDADDEGGYILKVDRVNEGCTRFRTHLSRTRYQTVYPDCEEVTYTQLSYIENYINDFESLLYTGNEAYANYIDVPSFVDYMLVNELAKNIDAYRLSTYLSKRSSLPDTKLEMGPVWDFNLAFGNADYMSAYTFDTILAWKYPMWRKLFDDTVFYNVASARWSQLREGPFSTNDLVACVDSLADEIGPEAAERNFEKWDVLGINLWSNYFVGETYENEIWYLKNWLIKRSEWMDYYFKWQYEEDDIDLKVYPNPFVNFTTIYFKLDKETEICIKLYNVYGQLITVVVNDEVYDAGEHSYTWIDFKRGDFNEGMYYLSIESEGKILSKQKVIVAN